MIDYIKKAYAKTGNDGLVMFLCTLSIFFTFYACVIVQLIALIYAVRKYSFKKILGAPHMIYPVLLMIPAIITGIFFRNYLGIFILLLFFILYLFSIYAQYMMTEDIRGYIINTVALSSIVTAVIALIQKYPNTGFRSVSLFLNANFYGYFCELTIVVMVYAIYKSGPKPMYFLSIAANIAGIAASGCRSAWTATAVGIIILMVCLKKYRHLIFTAFIGAAAALIVFLLPQVIFPRYSAFSSDKSLRFLIWKTAMGYIRENPVFGHGMFAYYALSSGRAHDAHAHDFILDLLINFGGVGTLILIVFGILVVRDLIKNLKTNKTCALVLAVLAAAFVHGFTDVPFIGVQTSSLTAMIIALAGTYGVYTKFHIDDTNPIVRQ